MTDDLNEVGEKDHITAAHLNPLIRALKGFGFSAVATVEVPNLFGRTLEAAKALLQAAGSKVKLGAVLDAAGTTIDPSDASKAVLPVIGQEPSSGEIGRAHV